MGGDISYYLGVNEERTETVRDSSTPVGMTELSFKPLARVCCLKSATCRQTSFMGLRAKRASKPAVVLTQRYTVRHFRAA